MAGTTADKLALLADTKAELKAALAEKGQTVGEVFSDYPAAVRAIQTGGSGIPSGTVTFNANYSGVGCVFVLKDGSYVTKNIGDTLTAGSTIDNVSYCFACVDPASGISDVSASGSASLIFNATILGSVPIHAWKITGNCTISGIYGS